MIAAGYRVRGREERPFAIFLVKTSLLQPGGCRAHLWRHLGTVLVIFLLAALAPPWARGAAAPAVDLTVLHRFSIDVLKVGPTLASDGKLYGTAFNGGSDGYGFVFSIATTGGAVTILHNFSYADGAEPTASLVQGSNGDFYGTTSEGGAHGAGTIFSMTPAGVLTTLYSFNVSDGATPIGGVIIGSDGNLYGTTSAGGKNGYGTVYQLMCEGMLTTLYNFDVNSGVSPQAGLVEASNGIFYGTTTDFDGVGPRSDLTNAAVYGTVFSISAAGVFTTLHTFDGADGDNPLGGLVLDTDGNFYGTTFQGGANKTGTIFRLTPAGAFTSIFSFPANINGNPAEGIYPAASLIHDSKGICMART